MYFKKWLENTQQTRVKTIPQGSVFYHGTLESFDTRRPRPGGYDEVFWTAREPIVAKTYIPSKGSYKMTSAQSILQGDDNEGIRKSLGITDKMRQLAWKKDQEGYKNVLYWDEELKKCREYHRQNEYDLDKLTDEFFARWMTAEDNYKKSLQQWKTSDVYLKNFVIHKMAAFGYKPKDEFSDYFPKVYTDEDGRLLPAGTKDVGKLLKVICNRDFRFFNLAAGKDGDLMDPDYKKIDLFRNIETQGFDGIIINDFGQSDYLGNFGHLSYGFFRSSIKDLTIKQIRNQTHPNDEEWGR